MEGGCHLLMRSAFANAPFTEQFCQSPVHHQHLTVFTHQDVLGLQIPVQDALAPCSAP
jgi:hypothetical protein